MEESKQDCPKRPLRILALHGFRENGHRFRGRLRGLLKRLGPQVEVEFMDAPIQLSAPPGTAGFSTASTIPPRPKFGWFVTPEDYAAHCLGQVPEQSMPAHNAQEIQPAGTTNSLQPGSLKEASISTNMGAAKVVDTPIEPPEMSSVADKLESSSNSRCQDLEIHLEGSASDITRTAHSTVPIANPLVTVTPDRKHSLTGPSVSTSVRDKSLQQTDLSHDVSNVTESGPCIKQQHLQQVHGWLETTAAVREFVSGKKPFDGILAFSQGCAAATLLLALQQLNSQVEDQQTPIPAEWGHDCGKLQATERSRNNSADGVTPTPCTSISDIAHVSQSMGGDSCSPTHLTIPCETSPRLDTHRLDEFEGNYDHDMLQALLQESRKCSWNFKFVMLCSGHIGVAPAVHAVVKAVGPLKVPSFHVCGQSKDIQVHFNESLRLMHLYSPLSRFSAIHEKGHLIPSSKDMVAKYSQFFATPLQT